MKLATRVHFLSKSLAWAQYDARRHQLILKFKSEGLYRYEKVAPKIFQGLLQAESKGRFFQRHIRHKFRFERLDS
jgi:hypothetical protein